MLPRKYRIDITTGAHRQAHRVSASAHPAWIFWCSERVGRASVDAQAHRLRIARRVAVRVGEVARWIELADALLELRDLLLQDLRPALLPTVVVFALLRPIRFDALPTHGLRGITFLMISRTAEDVDGERGRKEVKGVAVVSNLYHRPGCGGNCALTILRFLGCNVVSVWEEICIRRRLCRRTCNSDTQSRAGVGSQLYATFAFRVLHRRISPLAA